MKQRTLCFASPHSERGIVLVSTLLLLVTFLALFGAYQLSSNLDTATTKYSKDTATGFYAAEAGLNLRAETIRQVFVGFNRPTGTSPTSTSPCVGGNQGTLDFQCTTITQNNRNVKSYVVEEPGNPILLTIPPGERYQNLTAQEYRYTAKANAVDSQNDTEAQLELRFKTRLVPLFQFAAFYNKDLEILPGPVMTLSGPVHTNGDLWLYSNSATLSIAGQVTSAGTNGIYHGRKDGSVTPSCNNNPVRVMDPNAYRNLINSCPSRTLATNADLAPFNGMIQHHVQSLVVPGPEVFNSTPGSVYWDHADIRLALAMTAADAINRIEVRNQDDSYNAAHTVQLNACTGSVSGRAVNPSQFQNYRENKTVRLLDVDLQALFNCLRNNNWFGTGKSLADATDGGIVMHLTVKGPNAASAANSYGVRVRNAATLQSNVGGAPVVKGLTIVSDQAAYVMGNFNSVNKIPAAVMADSLNVLSNAWLDSEAPAGSTASATIGLRVASSTTINTAFLAGTDTTGGAEGSPGIGGAYNGGLENYPRFHENWSGRTMTYRGSFVSLGRPAHVNGAWSAQSYSPPNRDWNYDTSFNNAANLPPITPRFVYLKQELFVRDFEQ